MIKSRLLTPGPTPIPERVQQAMARPIVYHRGAEIAGLVKEVNEGLRRVFPTEGDILLFAASGTGVMEAAVVNLMRRGDRALVIRAGKFGERWGEVCAAFGVEVAGLDLPWGACVDPGQVADRLKADPAIRAVFATQSETSTGGLHDIEGIGRAMRGSEALLIVDGVSSLGAHPLPPEAWGVDCAITASQKGLMTPPGIGVATLGRRAWEAVERSDLPKHYWSFRMTKASLEKRGSTPATPATTLLMGLREALTMIHEEGIEQVWLRHARHAGAFRAGAEAIGLKLFPERPSNALTAVLLPDGLDARDVAGRMKSRYGIVVGEGLDRLAGRLIRLSNLGYVDDLDVVATVAALEMTLKDAGWSLKPGAGAEAAERVLTG
jgi:aspartate aminotransferase-like enzyme